MMILNILFMLIALGGGDGQDVWTMMNIQSSGDGESSATLTSSPVYLIDDNGDILKATTNGFESKTNGTEEELLVSTNMDEGNDNNSSKLVEYVTDVGVTSTSSSVPSTIPPTVVTDTTTPQDLTTDATTSEATTDIDSTTPTSTTMSTISIIVPTSAPKEATTVTIKQTTTFRTTTTMVPKGGNSEDQIARSTVVTLMPEPERQVCKFMDTGLDCNEDLVCYGEGEIDCTEDDDMTLLDKISVSSISEDYSDYVDADSGTIGTFPPDLVGVVSPSKKIPFLFNMRSLATTAVTDVDTTMTPNITERASPMQPVVYMAASTNIEAKMSVPETVVPDTTQQEFSSATPTEKGNFSVFQADEIAMDADEIAMDAGEIAMDADDMNTTVVTDVPTTVTINITETLLPTQYVSKSSDEETTTEYVTEETSMMETKMMSTTEVHETTTARKRFRSRGKREDIKGSESESPSLSMSMSFHAASVDSPQKKKLNVRVCRLSGDLVCQRKPTTAICKGKTYCQEAPSTAQTESSHPKGVQTWAIIVIVVCGVSASLTIVLFSYLVVTSCKKFKVQPTHEVTTLNYITGGNGVNEMA